MSLTTEIMIGLYLGVVTGIIPGLVAWSLGFIFKYFTGVTLPGFGVVVLGVALAGIQGGLLGLLDPAIVASPSTVIALVMVMMITLYAHAKGDKMGAEFPRRVTLRGLRNNSLSKNVIDKIGSFGEVSLQIKGEVGDIEGYPPLSPDIRAGIKSGEWRFPGDLPIDELERRFAEEVRLKFGVSEVEVEIDREANASVNAAPPVSGVSKRVPEGRRGVSIELLVPTGLARGDDVVIRTSNGDVSGTILSAKSSLDAGTNSRGQSGSLELSGEMARETSSSAPTTDGGVGRVTVSVPLEDASKLIECESGVLFVKSRGKRVEFELVSILKGEGKRFRKELIHTESKLAGLSIGEINIRDEFGVVVLALKTGAKRVVSPGGDQILSPGDELIVVGETTNLDRFTEACR